MPQAAPRLLYKYVPPERIDILENLRVRVTQFSALNDPHECIAAVKWIGFFDTDERIEKLISELSETMTPKLPPEVVEAIRKQFAELARAGLLQEIVASANPVEKVRRLLDSALGIISLSTTCTDPCMWAHYAAGHRGLCIGFRAPSALLSDSLVHVDYKPAPPEIVYERGLEIIHRALLRTKSSGWANEREVRATLHLHHPKAVYAGVDEAGFPVVLHPVPEEANLMVKEPGAAARDYTLRVMLSGGAPIAADVVARILSTFRCDYVQTYGMTETSPYLTLSLLSPELQQLPPHEQLQWKCKTGRPLLGVELRVVGDDGRAVAADGRTVGEIRVRGATVTPGYWQDPAATAAAFDRDGFLRTGDLATIDAHGYVDIVDRSKDVIKTGGEAVYSIEVENVLYAHAAVLECAVFGLPDATWGERVTAAVVLRAGASATAAELIAHCRDRIAHFKAPKEVRFLATLPRTGSGKITKKALRETTG